MTHQRLLDIVFARDDAVAIVDMNAHRRLEFTNVRPLAPPPRDATARRAERAPANVRLATSSTLGEVVLKLADEYERTTHRRAARASADVVPVLATATLTQALATRYFPDANVPADPKLLVLEATPYTLQNNLSRVLATAEDVARLYETLERVLDRLAADDVRVRHTDAQPRNIFVRANGTFLLGDFGYSRIPRVEDDAAWECAFYNALERYMERWQRRSRQSDSDITPLSAGVVEAINSIFDIDDDENDACERIRKRSRLSSVRAQLQRQQQQRPTTAADVIARLVHR